MFKLINISYCERETHGSKNQVTKQHLRT